MEKERLRSYFDESMIFEGIMYPNGDNISPRYLNRKKIKGVTVIDEFNTDVEYEDATEVLSSESIMIRGNFRYGVFREFSKPVHTSYEMYDKGAFNALVRMEDETSVSIKTSIGVERTSTGPNFDGYTVRDGLLPSINHASSRGMVSYREHFKILENGMQMIHYSNARYPDDDILFEMYSIPDGYKITDGLEGLHQPMVYNFKTFNKQHPAYHEIEELIKPKEKVKVNYRELYARQQEEKAGYYFK